MNTTTNTAAALKAVGNWVKIHDAATIARLTKMGYPMSDASVGRYVRNMCPDAFVEIARTIAA
jgi:hypothetical protein